MVDPYWVMTLAARQEWLETYDWVLAGARKGGHLVYLPYMPDPEGDQADRKGRLQRFEDFYEAWGVSAEKMPALGDPRRIEARWLEERYNSIGEDGVPKPSDWQEQKQAKDKADKFQADVRHQDLSEKSILITVDEQDLFDKHACDLQNHPTVREAKYTNMLTASLSGVQISKKSSRRRAKCEQRKRRERWIRSI